MAGRVLYRLNTFRLGLQISVIMLIDMAYHEAYLVPTTLPNFWTEDRLQDLKKRPTWKGHPFPIIPAMNFTRYHTENPLHADYIYARKSMWRYNLLWSFFGALSGAMQLHYLINSVRARWVFGAVKAVGALGLMGTVLVVEGNSRRMYINALKERVMEEEKAFE